MQTTFLKELMKIMMLKRKQSHIEDGYKSKKSMIFLLVKGKSYS